MATELVQAPPQGQQMPVPASPTFDHKVRYFSNKLVAYGSGHEITAADAPSPEERSLLDARRSDITRWLAPPTEQWIVGQLGLLQSVRAAPSGDKDTLKGALRVAVSDLADVPQFALARAFEAARRGEIGKLEFMPTPALLRQTALRHVEPLLKERRRIEVILSAKVRLPNPPGHRKAVAEAMREKFRARPVEEAGHGLAADR